MKKVLIIIFITLIVTADNIAQNSMNLFFLNPDGKGGSLSYADITTGDRINDFYQNPALLANIRIRNVSYSHLNWLAGFKQDNISAGQETIFGKFGLGVSYNYNSTITATDNFGRELHTMDISSVSVKLGYADDLKLLEQNLKFGFNLNYLRIKIEEYFDPSFSLDSGIIYQPDLPGRKLAFGLAVENLGSFFINTAGISAPAVSTLAEYDHNKVSSPVNIKCGASWNILDAGNDQMFLFLSYIYNRNNPDSLPMGLEYRFLKALYFRAGYLFDDDNIHHLSTGLGIHYRQYYLDLAVFPDVTITTLYAVTVGYQW